MDAANLDEVYTELMSIGGAQYIVPRLGLSGDEKDRVLIYLPRDPSNLHDTVLTVTPSDGFYHSTRSWVKKNTRRLNYRDETEKLKLTIALTMIHQFTPGRIIVDLHGKIE